MLTFNDKGYLIPNTSIKSNLQEFKNEFVDKIVSNQRVALYNKYIHYSDSLKQVLKGRVLLQWIDGSYVTKKAQPGDIDLVTFIDGDIVDQLGAELDSFKYPLSLEVYGVDAYIVPTYNRDNKRYPLFIGDQMYWMDLFDKTHRNRNGQKYPKGFLEIFY